MRYSCESAKEDYDSDNSNPIKCKGISEINSIEEENFSPKSQIKNDKLDNNLKEESSIQLNLLCRKL